MIVEYLSYFRLLGERTSPRRIPVAAILRCPRQCRQGKDREVLLKKEPHEMEERYRLLAARLREAARKASAEIERGHLLAIATRWDRVADYFQHHPRNSTG